MNAFVRSRAIAGAATSLLLLSIPGCAYPPNGGPTPPAAESGPSHYRALGTEPFWAVAIRDGRMVYQDPEMQPLTVTDFRYRRTATGHRYESARLTLDIARGECSDGMSENTYPDTVRVTIDGRAMEGCGGALTPPEALAGSQWRIVDINGEDVSGQENYSLSFDGARLSGRAGCNSLSGPYQAQDMRLAAGAIAATRMACPGPRMQHERFVLDLLRNPVSVWMDGDALTLSGETGFIRLRRTS